MTGTPDSATFPSTVLHIEWRSKKKTKIQGWVPDRFGKMLSHSRPETIRFLEDSLCTSGMGFPTKRHKTALTRQHLVAQGIFFLMLAESQWAIGGTVRGGKGALGYLKSTCNFAIICIACVALCIMRTVYRRGNFQDISQKWKQC